MSLIDEKEITTVELFPMNKTEKLLMPQKTKQKF